MKIDGDRLFRAAFLCVVFYAIGTVAAIIVTEPLVGIIVGGTLIAVAVTYGTLTIWDRR